MDLFVEGAIAPSLIADCIGRHQSKTEAGAHGIFLGQVRADRIGERKVKAIEYTAYAEMALEKMHIIKEEIFEKYPLICMHVYHSLGKVEAGEICLFVFTSSGHRKAALDACEEAVEKIKAGLPVWGKELFEDETHQWKVNK